MPHVHSGHLRYNMQDEEEVLNIIQDNPSTRTHESSSAREFYQNVVWQTVVSILSICGIMVAARGQTSPSLLLTMGATQDCEHSSVCVLHVAHR